MSHPGFEMALRAQAERWHALLYPGWEDDERLLINLTRLGHDPNGPARKTIEEAAADHPLIVEAIRQLAQGRDRNPGIYDRVERLDRVDRTLLIAVAHRYWGRFTLEEKEKAWL